MDGTFEPCIMGCPHDFDTEHIVSRPGGFPYGLATMRGWCWCSAPGCRCGFWVDLRRPVAVSSVPPI